MMKSMRIELAGHVVCRYRQEYDVKMDLGEIGWCGVDWIDLVQD
jgi:hypothetical protein